MTPKRRILHVSEAVTAGVPAGVKAAIEHAPDAEHVVLLVPRSVADGGFPRHPDASYIEADGPLGALAAMRKVARVYSDVSPDVVHAHSSFAGLYVRLLPRIPRTRIVYSPHCFAFERRDVGAASRAAFRLAEAALAWRTRTVVAFSAREASLARSLRPGLSVVEGSYDPDLPQGWDPQPAAPPPLVVAASGRLCAQKDPSFFASVVRRATSDGLDASWVWIGDGDERYRSELEQAGVEVTGWMERADVLRRLAASNACLHTAAWEATPIAVIEAAAIGLPVVIRRVPATEGTSLGVLVRDPAEAVAELRRLSAPDAWRVRSSETKRAVAELVRDRDLGIALARAYVSAPSTDGSAKRLRSAS